jgi:predicted RNase H-like nuclease
VPLRFVTEVRLECRCTELVTEAVALGVDWYKRGWVTVLLSVPERPTVLVEADLRALIARVPDGSCIAVDMPIGLPAVERAADRLARLYVGRRRNSVFMTPPREVLAAPSYSEANVIARRILGGRSISQQAWALRHNILLLDEIAREDPRIIEVHPEVSFRAMVGGELAYPKNSWNGQALRRAALAAQGIALPDRLDQGGEVPVADVLDAAAAAWSASRFALGRAASLPENAARDRREVIWY